MFASLHHAFVGCGIFGVFFFLKRTVLLVLLCVPVEKSANNCSKHANHATCCLANDAANKKNCTVKECNNSGELRKKYCIHIAHVLHILHCIFWGTFFGPPLYPGVPFVPPLANGVFYWLAHICPSLLPCCWILLSGASFCIGWWALFQTQPGHTEGVSVNRWFVRTFSPILVWQFAHPLSSFEEEEEEATFSHSVVCFWHSSGDIVRDNTRSLSVYPLYMDKVFLMHCSTCV